MRPRVTIEEVDDTDEPVRLPAQRPVEYPREAGLCLLDTSTSLVRPQP